jgi:hypothetical protein
MITPSSQFDSWTREIHLENSPTLDILDSQHILDTLRMCLIWIDNLAMSDEVDWDTILDHMPNNTGGRGWIMSSIEKIRGGI